MTIRARWSNSLKYIDDNRNIFIINDGILRSFVPVPQTQLLSIWVVTVYSIINRLFRQFVLMRGFKSQWENLQTHSGMRDTGARLRYFQVIYKTHVCDNLQMTQKTQFLINYDVCSLLIESFFMCFSELKAARFKNKAIWASKRGFWREK